MQALVEDLLSLAQADRTEPAGTLIPVDAALDLALGALRMPIGETGARIARQPLPEVVGNSDQLALVFQNLIGNSLKYRSEKTPEIAIGVTENAREWQFSVRDNGIGFDPAYAERIFGVFKRLHAGPEYPGTGIGLSIARKIIVQMEGRIWAVSQVGAGATFYFTLPKAAASGALLVEGVSETSRG
jgi:chemotaxis family two-component system sensor kinase Cph1